MAEIRDKGFRAPRHWTLAQRLAYYTAPPNERGCELWIGYIRPDGYGELNWRGRARKTHRLAWVAANGPISSAISVCHKCDVRACVNPGHLWLGDNRANTADMVVKNRQAAGSRHSHAKLTDGLALAIFLASGKQTIIAARFNISPSSVSLIKSRKIWRHIHFE